jgi:hypothetical protein
LTIGSQSIVEKNIKVVLSSGTGGTTYTVTAVIATSSVATLEGQGNLLVQ